jgi:hypothetical protein
MGELRYGSTNWQPEIRGGKRTMHPRRARRGELVCPEDAAGRPVNQRHMEVGKHGQASRCGLAGGSGRRRANQGPRSSLLAICLTRCSSNVCIHPDFTVVAVMHNPPKMVCPPRGASLRANGTVVFPTFTCNEHTARCGTNASRHSNGQPRVQQLAPL